MYTPPRFRFDDEAAALALAGEYNFALLITPDDGAPMLSHLPFIVDGGRRKIFGHVARTNPHGAMIEGREHIVVFTGPHAYVSPDWYVSKADVPTWNYIAVHVRGRGKVLDSEHDIRALLDDLSTQQEKRRPDLRGGSIWTMEKTPPEKLKALMRAIVAFEIDIENIIAKRKLGQNKSHESISGVVNALGASGDSGERALAAEMRKLLD